jgi:putative oxidoreductase
VTSPSQNLAAVRSKGLHVALWIVQALLSLFFLMAGVVHALLPIAQTAKNAPWAADLPVPLVKLIGIVELAGAVGIVLPALVRILPALTPLAAMGLLVVMALAIPFHISRGESGVISMHVVVVALTAFVAWGRFKAARISPRQTT